LGEEAGWRFGFGAAGVGMLISTAIYLYALRLLPEDRPRNRSAARHSELNPAERRAVWALALLFLPLIFFWAGYEQQGNTIALWADQSTDRGIALMGLSAAIPVTWFQAFNPFMIFAFTPFVVALWRRQAKRGAEPSTIRKMALGCFGLGAGNLVMLAAAGLAGADGKASWLWLLAYFAIVTLGELYLSPTALSLVTKVAPARTVGMMMGLWLATDFAGNLVAGWLGSFWSGMAKTEFFALIAAIGFAAGLVVLAFERPLKPIIEA
jgi:POT family proton-dependent oligopeptide transporter